MVRHFVAGMAVCAAVTAGVTLSNADAQQSVTTPTCQASQLRLSFSGAQGAGSTLQDTWRVTNVSGRTCRMTGYPGVVYYRNDGRPLPMRVTHLGTPHPVELAHAQHASFDLRFSDPGAINCTGEHQVRMTIRTPGARLPVIVAGGLPSCRGAASESPLRRGD